MFALFLILLLQTSVLCRPEVSAPLASRRSPTRTTASARLRNATRPPNGSVTIKSWYQTTLNWKQSLVQIQPAVNLSNTLPHRFLYQPKKTKTEHDKKAKKRKHDYGEEDEDEVRRVRQKLSKSGLHVALEILICSLHLRTSNPKRRPETKRDLRGRNPRKKRRRSGNGETRSSSPPEPAGAGTVS